MQEIEEKIDYKEIPALQQKRIITFVNHFLTTTIAYLNNFSLSCESKFMEFEYKVQKIEASLMILESQLSSLPSTEKSVEKNNPIEIAKDATETAILEETNNDENEESTIKTTIEPEIVGIKASDDPRYVKFFKLVKVGVQEAAVKLKMQSEGYDPSILDTPNKILPISETPS